MDKRLKNEIPWKIPELFFLYFCSIPSSVVTVVLFYHVFFFIMSVAKRSMTKKIQNKDKREQKKTVIRSNERQNLQDISTRTRSQKIVTILVSKANIFYIECIRKYHACTTQI